MPLKETHLINFRGDQIEMSAEIEPATSDDPQELRAAIETRLFEHQLEFMTDPALIDPPDLSVRSSIVSRDAVPPSVEAIMLEFGLSVEEDVPVDSTKPKNWLGRFSNRKRNRAHLRKWSRTYLRARDLSTNLARLEFELENDQTPNDHSKVAEHFRKVVEETLGVQLGAPSVEALIQLEKILVPTAQDSERPWVLLASSVRSITSFVGESIRHHAKESHWSENHEEDQALYVQSGHRQIVRSDPVLRVIRFIAQGSKALLSDYAKHVIRQSLTPSE